MRDMTTGHARFVHALAAHSDRSEPGGLKPMAHTRGTIYHNDPAPETGEGSFHARYLVSPQGFEP
jgi:hypothetical protein